MLLGGAKGHETDQLDVWTTVVTDLIALTQKKHLLWQKDDYRSEGFSAVGYHTIFLGNTLRFGKRPPKDDVFNLADVISGSTASVYMLKVFKNDGSLLTSCPPIAALDGLKIAIDSQDEQIENSFFEAVSEAARGIL